MEKSPRALLAALWALAAGHLLAMLLMILAFSHPEAAASKCVACGSKAIRHAAATSGAKPVARLDPWKEVLHPCRGNWQWADSLTGRGSG
jgi:hypothetical protein